MIVNKIILLILLITVIPTSANAAFANFWDDVADSLCISDPCNCGDNNSRKREYWDGIGNLHRSVDKDKLCPPYSKHVGRRDNTCLIKKNYPRSFIGYYENLCGEEAPESRYMNPKIRVRGQQCNFASCWTTNDILSWNGECVTLASGYGVFPGLHRMCARVAIPADYHSNFPQDPGYTSGEHLNFEGVTVKDETVLGYDGQPINLNPPKLCLYKDPAFFSFADGFDIIDLNPNKQSIHKTEDLHPIVEAILFIIDMAVQISQAPSQLIDILMDVLAESSDEGLTTMASVLQDSLGFMAQIIDAIGSTISTILRSIGQINRSVEDTLYGCVPIPLGPYPPPFCSTISPLSQTAYTQKICRTEAGVVLESTEDEPCVVSSLENNVVRNSIRITFENFVPLCETNDDPGDNDQCVVIENLSVFPAAHLLHLATGNTDIIPPCSSSAPGIPCVNTSIPVPDHCVGSVCSQDGFRVIYARKLGQISTPQSYFIREEDLPSCPSSSSASCQEIWGVNTSSFVDVSLLFPEEQPVPDISTLSETVSLTEDDGGISDFVASIVRESVYDSVFGFSRSPNQICVTKGTEFFVGCEDRAPFSKPEVHDCPFGDISCTSSYFSPKLVATISSGSDSTSAVIEPESVYNSSSSNEVVNLAGFRFTSFVTDDTYIKVPFSGANSPNPASIFGNYLDDIFPIDIVNGTTNYNAIYLSGLEYINGKYYLGGTQACLENIDFEKCPKNTTNCVLTNLLNRNIVNCENFFNSLSSYPTSVTRCTAAETSSCISVDTILSIPPNNDISILQCPITGLFCYTSPIDDDLCKSSALLNDRFFPAPSVGAILADNEYYVIDPIEQTTNNIVCTPIDEVVNCTDFLNTIAGYSNIVRCLEGEENTICTNILETIDPLVPGDEGSSVRLCDNGNYCYVSPTNDDLCQMSNCIGDSTGYSFDQSQYILRDKTAFEMGLCSAIEQPMCAATANYGNEDDGYAAWPQTQVGQKAIGSCQTGDVPVAPLERWCVPNPNTKTFEFSRLYTIDSSNNKVYSDVKCTSGDEIILISRSDDFPFNYPRAAFSNPTDYSGQVMLGVGASDVIGGYYASTLNFYVPDINDIDYFDITSINVKDFALVKINGTAIYSLPSTSFHCGNPVNIGNFNSMSYNDNDGTVVLTRPSSGDILLGNTCEVSAAGNIDLTPYLIQGNNTISIDSVLIGFGRISYIIDYKMNNP